MEETRCKRGIDPRECPAAIGIWADVIRWNSDGTSETVHKWQRVCDEVDGACAVAAGKV